MKVIAFKVEIDGVQVAIRNEQELAQAVRQVSAEYKQADYGSPQRKQAAQQLAQLKKLQADSRQEIRDLGREYQITEDRGKRSYRAINAELVNLRRQYKDLSAAERDVVGPDLIRRIQKLDTELKDIDAQLGQFQRNVGNYGDALGGFAGGLADLGGIDLAALASPTGAIAAAGTAAVAATQYLAEMSGEVRNVREEVRLLTQASGDQLDEFTAKVLAISETFNVTTNEVNQAANALSEQIGISFDEALQFIEDGFVRGLDINGEFIDSLREYPTFFAEAFGPGEDAANAFFNIIQRSNEQGIFSDKAVDTIKEATDRLRELPKATRDAIDAIGLDSNEIADLIENEGIGKAIEVISGRLGELRDDSPEVGQAVADIFGSPGLDAGISFLTSSLQDLTENTRASTEALSEDQKLRLQSQKVNEDFAKAQLEVADALGFTDESLGNVGTRFRTFLLRLVIPIIENFRTLIGIFTPIIDGFVAIGEEMGLLSKDGDLLKQSTDFLTGAYRLLIKPVELVFKGIGFLLKGYAELARVQKNFYRGLLNLNDEQERSAGANKAGRLELELYNQALGNTGEDALKGTVGIRNLTKEQKAAAKAAEEAKKAAEEQAKANRAAGVAAEQFAKGSLGFLRQELSELNKQLTAATGDDAEGILKQIIGVEEAIAELERGRAEIRRTIARQKEELTATPTTEEALAALGLPTTDQVLPAVKRTNEAVLDEQERFNAELDRKVSRNIERARERAERELEIEQQKAARIAEIQSGILDSFNGINDALAQRSQSRADAEIAALNERYEAEIAAAEGNADLQAELREEQAEQAAEIRARELEEQKRYRRAAVLASLAEGTVNILAAPTTIPDPFGAIFKAGRVTALGVAAAIQIGNINRQTVAARGTLVDGWVRGESHRGPNGGVSLRLNGRPVLAEAGENVQGDGRGGVAVINKRSAAIFRDQLNAMQGVSFPGKREVLSAINSYRGFGDHFERGGLIEPNFDSIAAMTIVPGSGATGPVQLSGESIEAIAAVVGSSVAAGSRVGTAEGAADANRRRERENILRQRTG